MPPSCTQLPCLSQVPKLYQQLYPPLHLGSSLFSLSLPRLHIKRWKHKRHQHKLIPGIFMLCKSSTFFSFCQSYKESNFYCNLVKSSKPSKLWQVDHQEEYPWNLHALPSKEQSSMPYYLKWFYKSQKIIIIIIIEKNITRSHHVVIFIMWTFMYRLWIYVCEIVDVKQCESIFFHKFFHNLFH